MSIIRNQLALAAFSVGAFATAALGELPVEVPERQEPVSFSREIAPLSKKSCVACHNATKAKAKLNLETVEAILKGSADGAVVVPGKASESLRRIKIAAPSPITKPSAPWA